MWTYIVLAEYLGGNKETLGLDRLNVGVHAFLSGQAFTMLALIAVISALTDLAFQSIRRTFLDW
jgi:ABC-type nitrate/sulfonate/bicarbonate transport system permease component